MGEEEGKSKREDWEQKRCEREGARTFSSCPFLPTLALMLYDEHDVAGEEQLRLDLFASIKLQITSQTLVSSEKFNEVTKILPKGI